MPNKANFSRTYIRFGDQLSDFETAQDVLSVVDSIMQRWNYSLSNIVGARISTQWLGKCGNAHDLEDELDLIFDIAGIPVFEVVLRSGAEGCHYGGWLLGEMPPRIAEETVNGHRVLFTGLSNGEHLYHQLEPGIGYEPVSDTALLPPEYRRRKTIMRSHAPNRPDS